MNRFFRYKNANVEYKIDGANFEILEIRVSQDANMGSLHKILIGDVVHCTGLEIDNDILRDWSTPRYLRNVYSVECSREVEVPLTVFQRLRHSITKKPLPTKTVTYWENKEFKNGTVPDYKSNPVWISQTAIYIVPIKPKFREEG